MIIWVKTPWTKVIMKTQSNFFVTSSLHFMCYLRFDLLKLQYPLSVHRGSRWGCARNPNFMSAQDDQAGLGFYCSLKKSIEVTSLHHFMWKLSTIQQSHRINLLMSGLTHKTKPGSVINPPDSINTGLKWLTDLIHRQPLITSHTGPSDRLRIPPWLLVIIARLVNTLATCHLSALHPTTAD